MLGGTQPFPPPPLAGSTDPAPLLCSDQSLLSFAGLGDAWGQPSRIGPLDNVAMELGSHLLQVVHASLLHGKAGGEVLPLLLLLLLLLTTAGARLEPSPHSRASPGLGGQKNSDAKHLYSYYLTFFRFRYRQKQEALIPLCPPSPKRFNQKCRGCPQEGPGEGEHLGLDVPGTSAPENSAVRTPADLLGNSSEF